VPPALLQNTTPSLAEAACEGRGKEEQRGKEDGGKEEDEKGVTEDFASKMNPTDIESMGIAIDARRAKLRT